MKSTVDNLSETRVKLTVEIPFEDLTDSINEAYKNIASQVNVPGFRRGKVPARIIDQRFGRGVVLEEVVQKRCPPPMARPCVRRTCDRWDSRRLRSPRSKAPAHPLHRRSR